MSEIVIFSQYRKQGVTGAQVFFEYAGKISLADQPLVLLV